jgi:hypothetical protein
MERNMTPRRQLLGWLYLQYAVSPATDIVVCVLINQLPAQAKQITTPALLISMNNPVNSLHKTPLLSIEICPNPTSD